MEDLFKNVANDSEVKYNKSDFHSKRPKRSCNDKKSLVGIDDDSTADEQEADGNKSLRGNWTDESAKHKGEVNYNTTEEPFTHFHDDKTVSTKDAEWTIFGYDKTSDPISSYPKRVIASGLESGLDVYLHTFTYINTDFGKKEGCRDLFDGYKLALHTPDEIPSFSDFIPIPHGTLTFISVKPRVFTTSDNLKGYSPMKRQCYFEGERKLRFFKHYNIGNCKHECLSGELR